MPTSLPPPVIQSRRFTSKPQATSSPQVESRSRLTSRCSSLGPESRQMISDQISYQSEKLQISRARTRSPSVTPTANRRRWSSILTNDTIHEERRLPSIPPAPAPSPAISRPSRIHNGSAPLYKPLASGESVYTSALIKHSQNLRDRSVSPSCSRVASVPLEKHVEYKNNKDYYRGKVKSVYEKEPLFKDFVRNIPLSETNFYESRNLSTLKKRFNFLVQTKHGLDANENYDPFTPSGRMSGCYEPKSGQLSRKHANHPRPPPSPSLPVLYIYHRTSRKL